VLFGERMRLSLGGKNYEGAIWARVYGDVSALVYYMPEKEPPRRYKASFAQRVVFADSPKAIIRLLESLIRRTGRALPAAALVSAKEWRRTNG
jgi:hypothetical protein